MSKAIVLLRVSSEGQTKRAGADEGYSMEVQRDGTHDKAAKLEADVVHEFVAPAQSASKGMYPALRQALDYVREHDIDYLIVYRLDRLARDELTQFAALAELRAAGTKLVSATENIDESPQGMLALGILASVNAYRSRDDGRKILDGLLQKAKLGGTPGRARLGYLNVRRWDGANDIRTVELDPERAPHMRWAFQAYATGDWPLRALNDALYERGLRTRSTPTRPEGRVGLSSLHRLLRDPYYIGIVRYRGVEYQGSHPKLITPELFVQVQQVMTAHHLAGEKHWKHGNYLKGTVHCGLCGRRLIFTRCTGRHGGIFDYFVCGGRHEGSGCKLPYLPAQRVERDVADYYLQTVMLDAERVAGLEPRLIEMFRLLSGYRYQEAERARRKIDDLLARRETLVSDHLAKPEAIPLDVLAKQQTALGEQLAAARTELAKSERSIAKAEKGLRLARQFLQDSSGTYREADPPLRRHWNQVFFKRLFLGPHGVTAAELTDEFAGLLREDLAAKLEKLASNPRAFRARGSNVSFLVETVGIEPTSAVA